MLERLSDRLPDVASATRTQSAAALEWVGMRGISVPVQVAGTPDRCRAGVARLHAGVDLIRGDVRGIHMSRLYAHASELLADAVLDAATLQRLLRGFLDSHAGLSTRASATLAFDLLLRRDALISGLSGWKAYPVRIEAALDDARFEVVLQMGIGYSSTCPASAALARQLIQQRFDADFGGTGPSLDRVRDWLGSEQGICATPHGQRSEASVRVRLSDGQDDLPFEPLVDSVEKALATPLQTAVKRVDEQEFARLNGANLMFCEDAARRIYVALIEDARYAAFRITCEHFESLHAHDAVAVAAHGL